ncbi:MAG: VOC family protein [Gemmatimonadota bacterium]
MIRRIKFASVAVSDQDRALEFYTSKLGFAVKTDQPMGPGMRWIELRIPGAETSLVLFTPPGQEDRIGTKSNIVFGADDIEATHAELVARGVVFDSPPTTQPWGTFAAFSDPDGNQFVLSSRH